MEFLMWLASCLEQGRTAIASTLADAAQRRRLERLQEMGALAQVRARVVICPACEAHSVQVIAVDKAACRDCGPVTLKHEHLQRLAPDGDWLRRRMAQALDLGGEPGWALVPERVWRLGDIGHAGQRRRVLFGQRLGDAATQRALLSLWSTHIGEIPTILVTTTAPERVYLPGVQVQLVPLPAAFRTHGNGLVADEAVWAGMLQAKRSSIASLPRVGPFAHDFRDVLLPGEPNPIALTPAQSSLLRVLWEQHGMPMHHDDLVVAAQVGVEKPIHAFQRQKYPAANRAYRALVRSDRRRRYWLQLSA